MNTCIDLQWNFALILIEIKFAYNNNLMQDFYCLASQCKLSVVHMGFLANCMNLVGNSRVHLATQHKSVQLVATCHHLCVHLARALLEFFIKQDFKLRILSLRHASSCLLVFCLAWQLFQVEVKINPTYLKAFVSKITKTGIFLFERSLILSIFTKFLNYANGDSDDIKNISI